MHKKTRKLIGSFLIITVMFGIFFATNVNAATDSGAQSKKLDYTYIEKALNLYYENIELGANNNLSEFLNPNLAIYLQAKMDVYDYNRKLKKISNKTNYKTHANLLDYQEIEGKICLRYQLIREFNFVEMLDLETTRSSEVDVIVDKNDFLILDIYDQSDSFDASVRGENVNIFRESPDKKAFSNGNLKNLESKKTEFMNRIDRVYEEESKPGSPINEVEVINAPKASTNLNRSSIVSYARNNYSKNPPVSGGQNVPYYDFHQISGSYDCTNFVSHALLAGGAKPYVTTGTSPLSTGWFYKSLSNRSSSWSGVPNLYNFLTSNRNKGPGGTGTSYHTQSPISWQNGDVLQFYSTNYGNWRHSTIITATYVVQQTPVWIAKPVITGRTGYNWFNNNDLAEDIYVNEPKRIVVSLKNYS